MKYMQQGGTAVCALMGSCYYGMEYANEHPETAFGKINHLINPLLLIHTDGFAFNSKECRAASVLIRDTNSGISMSDIYEVEPTSTKKLITGLNIKPLLEERAVLLNIFEFTPEVKPLIEAGIIQKGSYAHRQFEIYGCG